jgi:hypothetical protein
MTDTSSPSSSELPLPDYDHLPTSSLQHRIRTLTREQLQLIAEYERQHAHRPLVATMIQARLEELDNGAEPSGGSPEAVQPEQAPAAQGQSAVSPATSGPKMNPPSQGVPSNPTQPRSTG